MTENTNVPREFHDDPREMILKAAERTGLLREVAEMMFFLKEHAPENMGCAQCLLLDALVENLTDVFSPDLMDLFGREYEGLDLSAHIENAEAADFESYMKQFPLPATEA